METSKEELQSTNEELTTVNDELHNRNIDLDRANSDLNNVLTSTSMPLVMVDRGLRIRRLTAASANILKILPSDIGRSIMDIRLGVNVPNLDGLIAGVLDTLTPKELEVQDKEGHWYSLQIRPYRTTDDKIDGAVLVLSDIDPLKRLTERLEKSKTLTENILDTVREPLVLLAKDLKVLYVNPSFLKAFRVNRRETEGKSLYSLGNGQWNIPKIRTVLEEVLSKDMPLFDFEFEGTFPSLGTRTMLLNARRIIDGHSDEPTMLLAIEEISERTQEETVRARLAAIVESSDDAIIGKDLDGVVTSWNAGAERLFGYRAHEAQGQRITIIIPPDRLHEEQEILARLRVGERIEHFETVRKCKNGQYVDVSLSISPIHDATGRVIGASKIARDITARKLTEEALREREERFRHLSDYNQTVMNTMAEGLFTVDTEGLVTYLNASAERMLGWTKAELLGKKMHDLTHYKHLDGTPFPASDCPGLHVLEEEVELRDHPDVFIRKDGSFLPVIFSAVPLRADRKTVGIVVGFQDDTQRRQAEEALRQSHANLESLVEHRTAAVRELSLRLLRSQDDERRKISRELHDSLGQYLAHVKMSLPALKRSDATERENEGFSHLMDTIEECLTETRTISHLLHPPLLDEVGFSSAARWYVDGFSKRSGIQANLNMPHKLERLPVALELTLFRILQESLTNVHRHSHSQSAEILVNLGADEIMLQVRDYGQGMPSELLEKFRADGTGVGVGLRSMRERINELGGQFEIQSNKNGTLIKVTAPLIRPSEQISGSR